MIGTVTGVEGLIVVARVRDSDSPSYGYNARTDEYEDLVQSGVIDPTRVTHRAAAAREPVVAESMDGPASLQPIVRPRSERLQ